LGIFSKMILLWYTLALTKISVYAAEISGRLSGHTTAHEFTQYLKILKMLKLLKMKFDRGPSILQPLCFFKARPSFYTLALTVFPFTALRKFTLRRVVQHAIYQRGNTYVITFVRRSV
jgi:hypothetical protein